MDELLEIKNFLRGNIPDEDFWLSNAVARYFTDFAKALLNKYGTDFGIKVRIEYDKSSGNIAFTTFKEIVMNAGCIQVDKVMSRANKILYMKGLLAHEVSHILYMDNPLCKRYQQSIMCGVCFPKIPNLGGKEKPFLDAIKKHASKICSIAQNLVNILEDGYGENTYLANHYGSMSDGMRYMRKEFLKDLPLAEETENDISSEDAKQKWKGVCNLLLVYSLYHKLNGKGVYPLQEGILNIIKDTIDSTLQLDFRGRLHSINVLMVLLWEYIEPLLSGEQDIQNQTGGKPDHSNSTGNTKPVSNNHEHAQPVPSDIEDGDNANAQPEELLEEQVLEELSRKKQEEKNLRNMNMEANEGSSVGCEIIIDRDICIDEKMMSDYDLHQDCISISRRMQKDIKMVLDDRRKGGKKSGLYLGRKVEVRNVIRNDGRCFYNNKLPVNIPTICISLLIDESGSMSETFRNKARIEYAKDTAVILEDFCKSLGFAVSIIGSTADYQKAGVSELQVYSSFEHPCREDKYRLMGISPKVGNRDGAAFEYCIRQLERRTENVKILFVISDGRPNANGYGGEPAKEELKRLNSMAASKGIAVFAAAIGDDKEQIEEIYGDSFLDISELDLMPKIFISKIKKFIRL